MSGRCGVGGVVLLAALSAAGRADAQWPQFRGPNGSGVGADAGYPVEFSSSKNLLWKAAVPKAPSSPVVAGGLVFLTASQGDQLLTIALDAGTGRHGGLGTPVATGDTVFVTTLAGSEPWMPTFGAVIEKYDGDKDGRLAQAEFRGDPDLGEHFGWIDDSAGRVLCVADRRRRQGIPGKR